MPQDYFTIEAIPARKGDSLIIYEGPSDNYKVAIIDGGPSRVYKNSLKPRIKDIRKDKGLSDDDPLRVDFMMVSHLDDDHIKGILDLGKELKNQTENHEPVLLTVDNLWNNSFDDIIGNTQGTLEGVRDGAGVTASVDTVNWSDPRLDHDAEAVLASIGQGYKLWGYANFFKWRVNHPFGNDALIMQRGTDDDQKTPLSHDVTFTIIGPQEKEIEKLQKKYDKYLKDKGLGRNEREAVVAGLSQDSSVTNLSSLVLLLERNGKTILLTGDALGSKIIDGLEVSGHLSVGGTMHVDVLKMQHHGSDRNVTPDFFKRVTADHYIFCGDGEHGNPERQTFEWLMKARGDDEYTLHFTYPISMIDKKREDEVHGGHIWDHDEDSLTKLFENAGDNVTLSEPTHRDGVRINLADPLNVPRST